MDPDLYDIGLTTEKAESLLQIHNILCSKIAVIISECVNFRKSLINLQTKQSQISELLSRADDLVNQQPTASQSDVYAAMADSMGRAWRDLQKILNFRTELLELNVRFCHSYDHVDNLIHELESRCMESDIYDEHGQITRSIQVSKIR